MNRRNSKYDLTSDSEYEEAFLQTKIQNELDLEKLRILYQVKIEDEH